MQSRSLIKLLCLTILAAISVMAASASAAQAKYLLLLNGKSVPMLLLGTESLSSYIKAENGLKIQCTGGEGILHLTLFESATQLISSTESTFKGCVWVGSEKTCTINDGGVGLINATGTGKVVMPAAETYIATVESPEFATIFTEGVFCTLPEEEIISGSFHSLIENASASTKTKSGKRLVLNGKLGNSKITEMVGELHFNDMNDPNANWAVHLVEL
jgi:hypothetical protein